MPDGPAAPVTFRLVERCVRLETIAYRYVLAVRLVAAPPPYARLAVILKNPSTASATRSDATVGKVEAWARRATVAALLNRLPYAAMVGAENDAYIQRAVAEADVAVAAWGNPDGIDRATYDRRVAEVLRLVDPTRLAVVGPLTRLGYPRHGLLWNGDPAIAGWMDPPAVSG
jgi:hypothetical protein